MSDDRPQSKHAGSPGAVHATEVARAPSSHSKEWQAWDGELVRARSESIIDGRNDWAGQRYYDLANNPEAPEEIRAQALNGLAELAESPEGRAPRRLLSRYYRGLNDPQSVDQLHSLSLRIGSQRERQAVLKDRLVDGFNQQVPKHALISTALENVDTRRVELKDLGHALFDAWRSMPPSPQTLPLLMLASETFTDDGSHELALSTRLVYLEHVEDIDAPEAIQVLSRVLSGLTPQTPPASLEYARRNRQYSELRARASLLLDTVLGPLSTPAPAIGHSTRLMSLRSIGSLERPTRRIRPYTAPPQDSLAAKFDEEDTNETPPTPERREARLRELERRYKQAPTDARTLRQLISHYKQSKHESEELQYIAELSAALTDSAHREELADLYRRSSELLLSLGDLSDALRIRAESIYLSTMQSDDLLFILSHTTENEYPTLLDVLERLVENSTSETEVHLAVVATDLILEYEDTTERAWNTIYPSWRRHPNDRLAAERIATLSFHADKRKELQQTVASIAAEGAFKDAAVIDIFSSFSTRLGDDETLIALAVNAAAAAPLDSLARRKLSEVLLAKGRSLASGFRQVLHLLHDIQARKLWTQICAGALEAERRFAEAANLLLELYVLNPTKIALLDRALLNLEREKQWTRIFELMEEELSRNPSPQRALTVLRYMSRMQSFSDISKDVPKHAAVRQALLHVHDLDLDAHARSELAYHGDEEELISYLEKRASRVNNSRTAGDLYLEAADHLANLPDLDQDRLQRLLASARRAGVVVSELDSRNQRLARAGTPTLHVNQAPPSQTTDREEIARALWRSLVDSAPELRAERIASFFDRGVLQRTFQKSVEDDNQLLQTTSTELLLWLHADAQDEREDLALQNLNSWGVRDLHHDLHSYLGRIGIHGPLREEVLQALGDPLDSLRNHTSSCLPNSSVRNGDHTERLVIGFNTIYWLVKYTSLRLPTVVKLLQERLQSEATPYIRSLEAIPWIVGLYGAGSLLGCYRSLIQHLGIHSSAYLPELLQQMVDEPLLALLFAEWVYASQSTATAAAVP